MSELTIAGLNWRLAGNLLVAYGQDKRSLGWPNNAKNRVALQKLIAAGYMNAIPHEALNGDCVWMLTEKGKNTLEELENKYRNE